MAEYKVLITTAGVGSRLNEMTQYLNKALVRVGKLPTIGYILNWVPAHIPVVVTLGYYGSRVKDFLELTYPERTFEFVWVSPYEGPGSSMGYSLLSAREKLNCPFVLTSCDTIVFKEFVPPDDNWIGVCKSDDSSQYSTVMTAGDRVLNVNAKGASDFDFAFIGLNGINDYNGFWTALAESYEAAPNDSTLNDVAAIEKMIRGGVRFKAENFPDWTDIGNSKSLNDARKNIADSFDNLEKLDETIYIREPHCVVKFFNDENIIVERVKRAEVLKDVVPSIQGVRPNFYRYSYIDAELLAPIVTERLADDLMQWCKAHLWTPWPLDEASRASFKSVCKKFYKNKTEDRLSKFWSQYGVVDKSIYINGDPVASLSEQLESVDWDWISDGTATRFHGDLHFENILRCRAIGGDRYKLLDWRQDFGGIIEYGDVYYDLAKLNHGMLVSHDIVRRGLFSISVNEEQIACDILRPDRLVRAQEAFMRCVKDFGYDIRKIEVMTALIFLNIASLHHYPYSLFLYYYGQDRLAKAMSGLVKAPPEGYET